MTFLILLNYLAEDEAQFVLKIYYEYGGYMYKTAYDVLKNKRDAEDAVSDAMCKVIKYISKFENNTPEEIRNKIVICIGSIARNKAIDLYNKRKRRNRSEISFFLDEYEGEDCRELELKDETVDIEKTVISKENAALVRAAIKELPQILRDAVNLVYIEEYSATEAADYLGIKEAALRARLFRARRELKEKLNKEMIF